MLWYVAAGGLRTIAWVDAMQFFLLVGGITLIGAGVLYGLGGWTGLQAMIWEHLPRYWTHSHGVINWGWNWLQMEDGVMRLQWTGLMVFSYMLAMAGIQASPAFTMWAYSLKHLRLFPWQITFGSGVIVGCTLVLWSVVQGMEGAVLARIDPGEWSIPALEAMIVGAGGVGAPSDALVPKLMLTYLPLFFIGFAALGLLAAAQSTGAPYVSSFAAIATRNMVGEYLLRWG